MADKTPTYVVTAALVAAHTSDSQVHYFYAGATLPGGIVQEDLDRLLADGLIASAGDVNVAPVLGSAPPELDPEQTVPAATAAKKQPQQ